LVLLSLLKLWILTALLSKDKVKANRELVAVFKCCRVNWIWINHYICKNNIKTLYNHITSLQDYCSGRSSRMSCAREK